MANPDHIKVVLGGKNAISVWREQNPNLRFDLEGASLPRLNATHADLSDAIFRNAKLEWADFRWADLAKADFSGADLSRADFHKADIRRADFSKANLTMTNLEDADASEARFHETIFSETRLINTDFARASLLETAIHSQKSLIDKETTSKNYLPLAFLKGCGLDMPYQATVYKVMVASPSDVPEERSTARNVIYSWNDLYSETVGAVLLPVLWETHSTPELGDHPQPIINRQILEDSHILIVIFWSRIGTATPNAISGTIEEIERSVKAGKPVLVYFSEKALPQNHDPKQWKKLQTYKKEISKKGIYDTFKSVSELAEKIQRHLTQTLIRLRPFAPR